MKRRTTWLLTGLALITLVAAACSADAGSDTDDGGTSTPGAAVGQTATPAAEPTRDADDTSMPAGDVDTDRPPHLVLWDGTTPATLELGTYCWTSMCVDAIGVITTPEVYAVGEGAELRVDGLEAPSPEPELPVTGISVTASVLPGEPVASDEGWQAWHPEGEPVTLLEGANAPFTVDLEPGRYLISVVVTFDGGDALYGAVIEVS
ncbi:MAG: hypothetical protein GEU80_17020 [Dehalococcoidia bacterium]|nr:hypothetical protein [Dehalococcoidia bacterium]